MDRKLSYYSLKPHLKNLRFCGFYKLDNNAPKHLKHLHSIYMNFSLSIVILYFLQQAVKVYQVRYDLNIVMDSMFLLLTYSDCIYKQIVIRAKSDKTDELFNIMKGPLFNQKDLIHEKYLLRTARQAAFILYAFNTMALVTCFLWGVFPLVSYMQEKPYEFTIWLPFDVKTNTPLFLIVNLYMFIQNAWNAFLNTTMDALISFFLAQCKTQLSLLKIDLENIVQKSREEATAASSSYQKEFDKNFFKLLQHYQEIENFAKLFQDIFNGPILYQFLISGWIICTTAYRMVNINPISIDFVSMILYLICILLELFLFCFFGNEVANESESLIDAAFGCDWTNIPIIHRKDLIIFMERIKRAIRPMAGHMIPLSNSTFITVIRSSYTFYTFLKNTNSVSA